MKTNVSSTATKRNIPVLPDKRKIKYVPQPWAGSSYRIRPDQ